MRTKKEKSVTMGNRHSSATQYEVPSQSASLSELSNDSVLELFEQMLVSVCVCVCVCVCVRERENLILDTFTFIKPVNKDCLQLYKFREFSVKSCSHQER